MEVREPTAAVSVEVSYGSGRLEVCDVRMNATGSWVDAIAESASRHEPVFIPISAHCDDRGWSYMNLLTGVLSRDGQINFSAQNPGVIKAWHRHQNQTDCWLCLYGHLKVGVYCEESDRAWRCVFGQMRPGIVIIPPPLWHGAATVGAEPAGLLYYVTQRYNPAHPDEERRPFDSVPEFLWETRHR